MQFNGQSRCKRQKWTKEKEQKQPTKPILAFHRSDLPCLCALPTSFSF